MTDRVINNSMLEVLLKNQQRKLDGSPTRDPFLAGLPIRWIPSPESSVCPDCGSPMERSYSLMGGPYSGSVRCTKCTYRDSVTGYFGKSIFKVEHLPDGALPIYDRDIPPTEDPESK